MLIEDMVKLVRRGVSPTEVVSEGLKNQALALAQKYSNVPVLATNTALMAATGGAALPIAGFPGLNVGNALALGRGLLRKGKLDKLDPSDPLNVRPARWKASDAIVRTIKLGVLPKTDAEISPAAVKGAEELKKSPVLRAVSSGLKGFSDYKHSGVSMQTASRPTGGALKAAAKSVGKTVLKDVGVGGKKARQVTKAMLGKIKSKIKESYNVRQTQF